MNRGVEIASDVADLERSIITNQVTNGLAVRSSLLYLMLGGPAAQAPAVLTAPAAAAWRPSPPAPGGGRADG
jgi:aspartate carbamoyltransferase catalytic subunit